MAGGIHTPEDGIAAAIQKLAEPQVKIVSLTITEKGYCLDPQTRSLDLTNGLIQHDLQNPDAPLSAIGVIVCALQQRKAAGLAAFSVLSCDNLPDNGHLTRNAVLGFARQLDQPRSVDRRKCLISGHDGRSHCSGNDRIAIRLTGNENRLCRSLRDRLRIISSVGDRR